MMNPPRFVRKLLRNSLVPIILLGCGLLAAKCRPVSELARLLIQTVLPLLVIVLYTVLGYRHSREVAAAGNRAGDRLILASIALVLLVSAIVYPVTSYYLLRGDKPSSSSNSEQALGYCETAGREIDAHWRGMACDSGAAMAATREFNARLGYRFSGDLLVNGWVVQAGDYQKSHFYHYQLPYGEYLYDPVRQKVRKFVYHPRQEWEIRVCDTLPLPLREAGARRMETIFEFGQDLERVQTSPGESCQTPAPAGVGTNQLMDFVVPLSPNKTDWRRSHNGIPYFFNRVIAGFDPQGRLVYYSDDPPGTPPAQTQPIITCAQGAALAQEQFAAISHGDATVPDSWTALYIVQAVTGGNQLLAYRIPHNSERSGPYRLVWVT
ncbi:MAG TPA: hypothetical protein PKM88_16200, partial [bacterium]|nr:hypothetical protein [bacterium]